MGGKKAWRSPRTSHSPICGLKCRENEGDRLSCGGVLYSRTTMPAFLGVQNKDVVPKRRLVVVPRFGCSGSEA
jgi:hypothetical protein